MPTKLKTCITVDSDNQFLTDILREYYDYLIDKISNYRCHAGPICIEFGRSLGIYENDIETITDFNGNTLINQLEYYKKFYTMDDKMKHTAIRFVTSFYRWIVQNTDTDIFANSPNMCEKLLLSERFITIVENNYSFVPYDPNNLNVRQFKICFVIKNMERFSTIITKETYGCLDLSNLTVSFYRKILLEYLLLSVSPISFLNSFKGTEIATLLQIIYKMKTSPNYPNPKLDFFSTQEAIFIRNYIQQLPKVSNRTKSDILYCLKKFLKYCELNQYIQVDTIFYEYFSTLPNGSKPNAKTIPDEDLKALNQYFLEKGKDTLFYREMRVIFHLLLQTEFRISQICHLKKEYIHPTFVHNQYEIVSPSKTSNGDMERFIITDITFEMLMDIIEETEPIRQNCSINSLKEYIFVYTRMNLPYVLNEAIFVRHLKIACEELGIERYNPTNLRDTHMTLAYEHILRNNKSDTEMAVLSHHKHIDTTTNHYIEMKLGEMLESTYGITIGNVAIDTDNKVIETIPTELNNPESEVQEGCGICTAKTCISPDSLPCLCCSSFITTPKHEIYFQKAIENTDRLIQVAQTDHDREDLVTIKTLYVLYLKAILEYKEGIHNAETDSRLTGS